MFEGDQDSTKDQELGQDQNKGLRVNELAQAELDQLTDLIEEQVTNLEQARKHAEAAQLQAILDGCRGRLAGILRQTEEHENDQARRQAIKQEIANTHQMIDKLIGDQQYADLVPAPGSFLETAIAELEKVGTWADIKPHFMKWSEGKQQTFMEGIKNRLTYFQTNNENNRYDELIAKLQEIVRDEDINKPKSAATLSPELARVETVEEPITPQAPNKELAKAKEEFYDQFPPGTEVKIKKNDQLVKAEVTPKHDFSQGRLRIWLHLSGPSFTETRAATDQDIYLYNRSGTTEVIADDATEQNDRPVVTIAPDVDRPAKQTVAWDGKVGIDEHKSAPSNTEERPQDMSSEELQAEDQYKEDWQAVQTGDTVTFRINGETTTVKVLAKQGDEIDIEIVKSGDAGTIDGETMVGVPLKDYYNYRIIDVEHQDIAEEEAVESEEVETKERKAEDQGIASAPIDIGDIPENKRNISFVESSAADAEEDAEGNKAVKPKQGEELNVESADKTTRKQRFSHLMASLIERLAGGRRKKDRYGDDEAEDSNEVVGELENEQQPSKLKRGLDKVKTYFETSRGRKALLKMGYDTATTIFGVKFITDLAGVAVGKGDIAEYIRQRRSVSKEREDILEAALSPQVEEAADNYREKIKNSKSLSAQEKEDLIKQLETILAEDQLEKEDVAQYTRRKIEKTLDTYIQTKIKAAKLAKDFLYFSLAVTAAVATAGHSVALQGITQTTAFSVGRAGTYFTTSGIERAQKASSKFEKDKLTGRLEKDKKLQAVLKDLTVTSAQETWDALRGKGKTKESEHKGMDRAHAIATLARAAGVTAQIALGMTLPELIAKGFHHDDVPDLGFEIPDDQERAEVLAQLLHEAALGKISEDQPTWRSILNLFETDPAKFGLAGLSEEQIANMSEADIAQLILDKGDIRHLLTTDWQQVTTHNVEAATDTTTVGLERADLLHKIIADPKAYGYTGAMKPEDVMNWTQDQTAGIDDEHLAKLVESHQHLGMLVSGNASEQATATATQVAAEPTSFEDVIDSSQVTGADSIWKSTHHIFETHAKELGYSGDTNDHEALSHWAEAQTAQAMHQLNEEQGGNLADLVHDGDIVKIDLVDGQPHLSFEAASGIEASHLSDTNVSHFFAGAKPEHGSIEANFDSDSGDQYYEFSTDEGVYKVYDWDRDGQPNVIMPDGSAQEMSLDDLRHLMETKDVVFSQPELDSQAAEAASQAVHEQGQAALAQFMESDEGKYESSLYFTAKSDGQVDELLHRVLAHRDWQSIEKFFDDYCEDQHISENKTNIFLSMLHHESDGGNLADFDGSPDDLIDKFDNMVVKDFDKLDKILDNTNREWYPIKIGDQYALVHRDGAGLFRRAKFFLDLNGDGQADPVNADGDDLHSDALKEMFAGKRSVRPGGAVHKTTTSVDRRNWV